MVAFKMMPVMDMNEVSYHMLEVTHSHLVMAKQSSGVRYMERICNASRKKMFK